MDKKAFDEIMDPVIHNVEQFLDDTLREQTTILPGRSFFVIHERNAHKFKDLYGERSAIILKKGAHIELDKDPITGIYQMHIFG